MNGIIRIRSPVNAAIAFATAGAIGGSGGSPNPVGRKRARDEVRVDRERRFAHADHPVIAKVARLGAAVGDRHVAVERRADAVDDAALHLRLEHRQVHRLSHVANRRDLVNGDALLAVAAGATETSTTCAQYEPKV